MAILFGEPLLSIFGNPNYSPSLVDEENEGLGSITIGQDGVSAQLVFNEPQIIGDASFQGFDLGGRNLQYLSGDGTTNFSVFLSAVVYQDSAPLLSYTSSPGGLTDESGNPLESFTGFSTFNNSTQPGTSSGSPSQNNTLVGLSLSLGINL